jgi:hypothetical protein
MVHREVMLGFHQALDQRDGFFLGVTSVRGFVRSIRFVWNHVATSSVGCMVGKVRFSKYGVSAGHGVGSQLGQVFVAKGEGGVIVIWMTGLSEPEGGRLFFQDWIKEIGCVLAKQRSMTLDLWEFAFVMRGNKPGVFRREFSVSSAAKKWGLERGSSLAVKSLSWLLIGLWMLKSPSTIEGSEDLIKAVGGATDLVWWRDWLL